MQEWRTLLFAGAIVFSPPAMASTELHVSAGSAGGLFHDAAVSDLPGDAAAPSRLAGVADDESFTLVSTAHVGRGAAPPASRHDRFSWIFLLIAFAGLTAVFAGKRSRGRGLIAG